MALHYLAGFLQHVLASKMDRLRKNNDALVRIGRNNLFTKLLMIGP